MMGISSFHVSAKLVAAILGSIRQCPQPTQRPRAHISPEQQTDKTPDVQQYKLSRAIPSADHIGNVDIILQIFLWPLIDSWILPGIAPASAIAPAVPTTQEKEASIRVNANIECLDSERVGIICNSKFFLCLQLTSKQGFSSDQSYSLPTTSVARRAFFECLASVYYIFGILEAATANATRGAQSLRSIQWYLKHREVG
ncbi:hypothetical protein MLD38_018539 [Melastoma candidum]|uniref:Uncharacterized protein n=1 Tax=Melastoma candidum TaxID=119954 RepID=A0ACB9QV77_9MYRT|nr:hypothetical protein MLD38_018539 [Melastoma candidum]